MTLLAAVVAHLRATSIPHAIVGAAAMSAHGIARATADVDLLTTDQRSLASDTWVPLEGTCQVDVRRGDHDDPLAGVVRFTRQGELDVDIVVGKHAWQDECVQRASTSTAEQIPVVELADLVLLKLYAGGPQDAWDIQQILGLPEFAALIDLVDTRLSPLPAEATRLWRSIAQAPGA
jgi:hypothetical protein